MLLIPLPEWPCLLVSVRDALEARDALVGGVDILDVKEPLAGPLGRATVEASQAILRVARENSRAVPVSVALGDLDANENPGEYMPLAGISFFKLALAGWGKDGAWQSLLDAWSDRIRSCGAGFIPAAYADWEAARSPSPEQILDHAADRRLPLLLVDTFAKTGESLRQIYSDRKLELLLRRAHLLGLRVALAGSLGAQDIAPLLDLGADVIAVRGAACGSGGREGTVQTDRVLKLSQLFAAERRRLA